MTLGKFFQDYRSMVKELHGGRVVILILILTVAVLSVGLVMKRPVVVLVPPNLSTEGEIAANNASAEVKKAWGLMVANLAGNVSPGNVNFVGEALGKVLDPSLYNELQASLQDQALALKEGQLTLSFAPENVIYQASRNRVFVTGQVVKQGPFSEPVKERRTYEFEIVIRDYRPYVVYWDSYSASPKLNPTSQDAEEASGRHGDS